MSVKDSFSFAEMKLHCYKISQKACCSRNWELSHYNEKLKTAKAIGKANIFYVANDWMKKVAQEYQHTIHTDWIISVNYVI